MITPIVAALIGLGPVVAAPRTMATTSVRSEARLRTGAEVRTISADDAPAYDLDTTGTLGVTFDWKRVQLSALYAPRLVLTDVVGPEASRDFAQGLDLLLAWQSRSYTLTLMNHVEYGRRRFTALDAAEIDPATRRPVASALPGGGSVLYGANNVQASLRLLLSARSDLVTTVGYAISGGLNDESRQTLPLTRGPRFETAYGYALTRRDTVGLGVTGTWVRNVGGGDSGPVSTGVVGLSARWDRTWPLEVRSSLSAGGAVLIDRERDLQPVPQAFATVTRAFVAGPNRGAFEVALGGGTATDVDPLTGTTRPSVRATGQVAWVAFPFRTYVLGAALKTLKTGGAGAEADAATMYTADIGASYFLLKPLALDVGVRLIDQEVDLPTTPSATAAADGFSFAAFVALAWRPEPFDL